MWKVGDYQCESGGGIGHFYNWLIGLTISLTGLLQGYYAMSGTSQKNSKIQNSTVEKKNISLVQLTNAAISLLNL